MSSSSSSSSSSSTSSTPWMAIGLSAGAALAAGASYLFATRKPKVATDVETPSLKDLYEPFLAEFSGLADEFIAHSRDVYKMPERVLTRTRRMLDYTCVGGKMNRGLIVVKTYQSLRAAQGLDYEEGTKDAIVLGWCIEVMQACFLVADDIMDASTTRRGQPCWYLLPDVQLDAVNDSLVLESFMYFLIQKYFGDKPTYNTINELYREVCFQTQMGQMLDLMSQPQGRKGLDILNGFDLDLYKNIVHYKTAFYSFYLPLAAGMIIAGYSSAEQLAAAREISIEIGEKFQIQDDYLDCFGEESKIGKKGTDIQDHKCSWLVVQAIKRVNAEQRKVLEQYYGKEDEESEAQIKQLYTDLDLETVYFEQEEASKQRVLTLMDKHADVVPPLVFQFVLDKIHLRDH